MKPTVTLVLIADDRSGRLLVNDGVGKGLREIASLSADSLNQKRFEFADRRGRESAAPGMARHALEPATSPERQARDAFAALLGGALREAWASGGYQRIMLAAAPRMLGTLRAELDDLADRIGASLDKDLVKVPTSDLPRHFADVAAF